MYVTRLHDMRDNLSKRLPKCEKQIEKWLSILGIENLNTKSKHIFICSLRFEEKCFNRTLNVTRLRDDALPSSELLLSAQFNKCEEQKSVSHIVREETPVCSISSYVNLPAPCYRSEKQQTVPRKVFGEKPVCSTSNFIEDQQFKIIQKLKMKCEDQRKKN
ncbi:unnamed protein product [Parnassius apollo]|uniref:(apollo) hypothetical protein n=1 Tax=Parnassius apollo TaxID=110799 RepID=A0A8S3XHE6_PARAO|nr:unnamed protein product [Parnassius apollo]